MSTAADTAAPLRFGYRARAQLLYDPLREHLDRAVQGNGKEHEGRCVIGKDSLVDLGPTIDK